MADEAYWGYYKHKIDQMWKELDDLKQRVKELESRGGMPSVMKSSTVPSPIEPGLVPVDIKGASTIAPPVPVIKKTDYEDVVITLLKKAGPMNIVDINSALVEQGIEESVRDTLFNRVKVLMKKGAVKYDEKTQKFASS